MVVPPAPPPDGDAVPRHILPAAPRRRPLVAALVLLTAGLFAPAAGAQTAGQDFQFAVGLYKQGRYDDAAKAFTNFLESYPGDANAERAAFFEGFSLRDGGKAADAKPILADAIRRFPESDLVPDALFRLALAEEATAGPGPAAAPLERLVREHPRDKLVPPALEALGRVRLAAGDTAGAAEALRKFLDSDPEPAERAKATRTLAKAVAAGGDVDGAAGLLEPLADGGGPGADYLLSDLGLLRYGAGDYDAAADAFTELLNRNPPDALAAEARLNRGYAYFQAGRYADAERDLAAAAEIPRFAAAANLWAGAAARRDARPLDAERYLRAGLAADPPAAKAAELRVNLARLREASGTEAGSREAAELYERAATDVPDSPAAPDALLRAAAARRESGEADAAAALLERFRERYPNDELAPRAELLDLRLAEAAAFADPDAKTKSAALAEVERRFAALAASEDAPAGVRRDARIAQGKLTGLRGDPAAARKAFESVASSLKPGEDDAALADALLFAAQAAAKSGDAVGAAETAGRFLETFPDDPRAGAARATLADAAAEGDLGEGVKAYEAAVAAGRTPATDALAVRLADRAVSKMDELAAENPGAAALDDLAATVDRLVGPIAEDDAAEPQNRAGALFQLGWAAYNRDRFAEAARRWAAVRERFAETKYADQALALEGTALALSGQNDSARTTLKVAWDKLAPAEPAPAGADANSPVTPVWLAGVNRARLLAADGDVAAADDAFRELNRLFPNTQVGQLLWDWSQVHYRAADYVKADELFARLVAEDPTHPKADSALLYLAEGDFVAGRSDAAAAKLGRLVEPAPDEPVVTDPATAAEAAVRLTTALIDAGENDRAAALAARAAGEIAPEYRDQALRLRLLAAEAEANSGDAAAARGGLADVRADAGSRFAADPRRPEWAARPWVAGAKLAFAAGDHRAVDELVAELEAWTPPPADLFQARAVKARSLAKRPAPDFVAAEALADAVMADPAAGDTQTLDDLLVLKLDLALLVKPPDLAEAKGRALRLSVLGTTDAAKAVGLLQAGRIEEQRGDEPAAAAEYQRVLAEYPDAPAAADARARLDALDAAE